MRHHEIELGGLPGISEQSTEGDLSRPPHAWQILIEVRTPVMGQAVG